jgi:hypothetical protein
MFFDINIIIRIFAKMSTISINKDKIRLTYQAATYRAQRMELLYKRNKFLTSQLERKVYSNFEDFINQYNKGIK